ncbi:MAG: M48 family metalloprotease [Alteromonadaceae bacterium]|nr:M48 family metalloprotease [Alteromonadaceae bacterium]
MRTIFPKVVALLVTVMALAGCSVNPVTGERELSLVSENQERSIGAEQYVPTQQTQGGQFYIDPELTVYVREVGQKLARVSDRPDLPYEFVVLNNSTPNAWALPGGKIAINRGLLVKLEDEAQLASVLAHEIVHAAARHGAQRMQQGMIISAGMAGLGLALSDNEWAGLVMGGAAVGAQVALAQYSQGDELESDAYGIRYMHEAGYDPQAAVELQELFLALSKGQESSWLEGLFATHPPSAKRVEENRKLARELGANGFRGEDIYQRRTAKLRSLQPAYDAHQKAVNLASEKQFDEALAAINTAIEKEPREAMFYALRGRIHQNSGNRAQAEKDFDKAVSLYPEMFEYQLYNGLNALAMNNVSKAREHLEKANEVVPTAIGYLRLGDVAVQQSQRQQAIQYYSAAAQAGGDVGTEAKQKLAALQ